MTFDATRLVAFSRQLILAGSTAHSALLQALGRQPRSIQRMILALLFVLTAMLDLVLDRGLSLFAVYLIPTLYAAWFLGTRWGYGSCIASAIVWSIDDWGESALYHYPLVPYLNIAGKLVVLAIIVAIVLSLKNTMELEHEVERRAVQREFEIAYEVQNRLLPSQPPDYPPFDFGYFYRPAREVGGDYFDFIPFDEATLGLAVGDVSGKGLSSALLMATLQGLVRMNLAARHREIVRFALELNQSLFALTARNRYATLFFAVVDVAHREMDYVNAGQNPPFLFRNNPAREGVLNPEKLGRHGPPVGILGDSQYPCGHVHLEVGDVLVAYTDGVIEAVNAQQEEFGEERLIQVAQSARSLDAGEICRRIEAALQSFAAGSAQFDDITVVVMKVNASYSAGDERSTG